MTGVLIKTVRGIFDFRKATRLRAVIVNPVSIAEQSHITQSLLGTGIIASDFYWLNWGIAMAARMPMIAITISNSMRVKPATLNFP